MENKENINESIKYLVDKKIINVRSIPSYSLFDSADTAREEFSNIISLVDGSITKFEWMTDYDKIIEWMLNTNGRGLLLTGNPGLLKTVVATLVIPVLFNTKYQMNIRPVDSINIENHYQYFNNSPVIVVDDVGVEPPVNDFGIKREPFSLLVDFCEKKSKVLIFTTNLSSERMIERYGIRTVDRQDKICTTVKLNGESKR